MVPVARPERSIRPDDLAPLIGRVCDEAELPRHFGIESLPPRSDRHAGHLAIAACLVAGSTLGGE